MIGLTGKAKLKTALHALFSGSKDSSSLRVLAGPARGVRLDIDLRMEASYWLGSYDDWITERVPLALLIKEGDTAWDCGAYIGYYTAIFRKLVGPAGLVYAFEGSSRNFRRVSQLPELNDWDNVKVLNLAIGPENTSITFASAENGASGPVGLVDGDRSHRSRGLELVRSCGVDELVEKENVPKPKFIKFDLETGEVFALKNGAALYTQEDTVLLLELHGNEAMQAAFQFAIDFNYLITDVYALPRHRAKTVLSKPQAWVDTFATISTRFMNKPPVDAPHMTLAIPKRTLSDLARTRS